MSLFRHILMIVLLGFSSYPVVAEQVNEGADDYAYAINMASSLGHIRADDLPELDVLLSHRVYTASFVKDGKTWNRLRVGFFGSRSDANKALDVLKAHYPDAWIAEVSVDERLDSSRTVLGVRKSIAVAETGTEPLPASISSHVERRDHTSVEYGNVDGQESSKTVLGISKPIAAVETGTEPPPASISSHVDRLALAGAEYGDENAYYYGGLLVPFPGSDLGNGFVQRYWLDWLQYEYDNDTRTIKAEAPGASVALGYGKAVTAGSWSIYMGPVWRNTNLSPDDKGSDVRGSQWGANISLQGERRFGEDWRVNGIASFTTGTDSYWTRGRLTRKLQSGQSVGVEAVFHGNDDYSAWQAGVVMLDIRLTPVTSLGLKGGARKTSGEDIGAYLGIELTRSF